MKNLIYLFLVLAMSTGAFAQNLDMSTVNPEYIKVLEGRTAKFLDPLNLGNKSAVTQKLVIEQYCNLSAIHDSLSARKERVRNLGLPNAERDFRIDALKDQRDGALMVRHFMFVSALLSEGLTYEQVDQIKDGMTYNVMNNTYDGYLDMLQNLTEDQKKYIWKSLYEARERAMDESSSDDKHKMFGKYKGRINNYLSQQGYDLNAESKAWHDRLKAQGKKL